MLCRLFGDLSRVWLLCRPFGDLSCVWLCYVGPFVTLAVLALLCRPLETLAVFGYIM